MSINTLGLLNSASAVRVFQIPLEWQDVWAHWHPPRWIKKRMLKHQATCFESSSDDALLIYLEFLHEHPTLCDELPPEPQPEPPQAA